MQISNWGSLALVRSLLAQRGTPERYAALQADVLVEAELKGHPSHGLQRLPRLLARMDRGLLNPSASGQSHWRSDAVLVVEGEQGLGPVVAMQALHQLHQRAASTGIALAAIRNSNHLGMLAWYVEHIAARGCIGIVFSSSEALVHPHGGTRAFLGTNPFAIAVPTAGRPLVLDASTSMVSMGKIHHYAASGRPLPEGWARDREGHPTTDAARAMHGAIAPFGGAKGYGLGIAIELLIAALAGSALAPNVRGTLDADALCNKGRCARRHRRGFGPRRFTAAFRLPRHGPRLALFRARLSGAGARRRRCAAAHAFAEEWFRHRAAVVGRAPVARPPDTVFAVFFHPRIHP